MRTCINCKIQLVTRHQIKYCSNLCQGNHKYKKYVIEWKKGAVNGNIGITSRNTSQYLRKFLLEKYEEKCAECGWDKKHPVLGHCPLEIEHIYGNSENNKEENLKLLCPNCHAMTPYYKNLNRGKGRRWRMDKYIKNKPTFPFGESLIR